MGIRLKIRLQAEGLRLKVSIKGVGVRD